jgi:hypothetical protein
LFFLQSSLSCCIYHLSVAADQRMVKDNEKRARLRLPEVEVAAGSSSLPDEATNPAVTRNAQVVPPASLAHKPAPTRRNKSDAAGNTTCGATEAVTTGIPPKPATAKRRTQVGHYNVLWLDYILTNYLSFQHFCHGYIEEYPFFNSVFHYLFTAWEESRISCQIGQT